MSSHHTMDYVGMFQHLNQILSSSPEVSLMVLYFELLLWKAIKKAYPEITSCGYAFHWTQSVWCKIQGVGLQSNNMQDVGVLHLCRQLLGLPFVPARCIRPVFRKLQE